MAHNDGQKRQFRVPYRPPNAKFGLRATRRPPLDKCLGLPCVPPDRSRQPGHYGGPCGCSESNIARVLYLHGGSLAGNRHFTSVLSDPRTYSTPT